MAMRSKARAPWNLEFRGPVSFWKSQRRLHGPRALRDKLLKDKLSVA